MFSDLAHSARPSAVTDPDTAARHSLPPAFPNRPSPLAPPLAPPLPRITRPRPQPLPLPPLESGLSGVLEAGGRGGAPWVWEDDRVQAEQLALECGKRRVEPHTTVGKNSCSYSQPQHVAPHQGQPTALSCLEQWPPAGCCRVSPCWEARRAQGRANHAPCASTCRPIIWHQLISAGKALLTGSHGSPRPQASEASGHTESSAHAPELSHRTPAGAGRPSSTGAAVR